MALSRIFPASVHLFERGGFFVLLDVPSGSIFSLDERVYRYLQLLLADPASGDEAAQRLTGLDAETIVEIEDELEHLIAAGCLFTEATRPTEDASALTLKSLCLNVAHECNFSCSYCFAHGGDYRGTATLMTRKVARAGIDFLVRESGSHHNVEVDFFGGEPLMNWDVVVDTIDYARSTYASKKWRFTLTTNGSLLRDDMLPVLEANDVSVVLSLDGGRKTNDANRVSKDGRGTFDTIVEKIRRFTRTRDEGGYFVRGTYARNTLSFAESVRELHSLGFKYISMEPVVLSADSALALQTSDLPAIRVQYEELIAYFLSELGSGSGFDFFHFKLDLEAGPCLSKRIYGCGAGVEYMAVAPNGDIFPCHQFDGIREYRMGNVLTTPALDHPGMVSEFAHANFLFSKKECGDCWARFYCSGGCLANNFATTGSLLEPYALGCLIQKERIEAALAVKAAESPENAV
ncbi:MAG TPA: thioether cross-link-forming SCIFF peptide maturase [Clostridia bacterium]|nr:thioether cross-link-forming SCIFF peptide maturase [Clostridia bacterium]